MPQTYTRFNKLIFGTFFESSFDPTTRKNFLRALLAQAYDNFDLLTFGMFLTTSIFSPTKIDFVIFNTSFCHQTFLRQLLKLF